LKRTGCIGSIHVSNPGDSSIVLELFHLSCQQIPFPYQSLLRPSTSPASICAASTVTSTQTLALREAETRMIADASESAEVSPRERKSSFRCRLPCARTPSNRRSEGYSSQHIRRPIPRSC
jgi:hypothetical protein